MNEDHGGGGQPEGFDSVPHAVPQMVCRVSSGVMAAVVMSRSRNIRGQASLDACLETLPT